MAEDKEEENTNNLPREDLSHLTEEEKRARHNRQKLESKRRAKNKEPKLRVKGECKRRANTKNPPRENISHLTEVEKRARRNQQKRESKQRAKAVKMMNDTADGLLSTPTDAPIMSFDDLMTTLKTQMDTEKVADEDFLEQERQYEREQDAEIARRRQEQEARDTQRHNDNRASRLEMHNSLKKSRMNRFEDGVRQWHTTATKMAADTSAKKQRAANLKASQQVLLEDRLNATMTSPPAAKKEEVCYILSFFPNLSLNCNTGCSHHCQICCVFNRPLSKIRHVLKPQHSSLCCRHLESLLY